MLVEPRDDVRMLVGGKVVDDDMDGVFLGHSGVDDVQKADKLLMAMTLHALAPDLAIENIERCEQSGDAMTFVVMGHSAGAPLLHRQAWRGPRRGAKLGFFFAPQK